jgi:hypothetical protein
MDHDAPPTPATAIVDSSPSKISSVAKTKKPKSVAKSVGKRIGKRVTHAKSPPVSFPEDDDAEEGPIPPAADFEAMLEKAMAEADGGDVNAVLGGASSKMMNSPMPARRRTPARLAKEKTPETTPTRVTRVSAGKGTAKPAPVSAKKVSKKKPTPEKTLDEARVSKPEWVVPTVDPDPLNPEERNPSTDRPHSRSETESETSEAEVSPVPEAPSAPPPPPSAWLKKAKEAKRAPLLKPPSVSTEEVSAPVTRTRPMVHPVNPPVAHLTAPVAPVVAARDVIAALAAARSNRAEEENTRPFFDFEAKLQAALDAEAFEKGGAAAFGGTSKVCNSPTNAPGERKERSIKEEARRQGVSVAQLMHARAHADSSPLTKVRF